MLRKADGTIYINTQIDAQGFNAGTRNMQRGINSLDGAFKKLGVTLGTVFAVKELVEFGKDALELGSNLQEVQNVVDVTFTTMSDKVDEFARNAAKTAGLSETMAKKYTGTFGAMAKAFGFAEEDAFEMSTALTQLSGDVASFYNLSQDEAFTKLKAVFSGETEGLKDLGVVMTQASLDAYALANGFGTVTSKMTEQQKTALRYQFVVDRLAGASGDYVRTLDGWANQTRTLQLNIDSLKATIGQGLINLFTPAIKVLNAVIERLMVVGEAFRTFTENVVGTKSKQTTEEATDKVAGLGESYNETADGIQNYVDSTKDAISATKRTLSPLDDLNNLTSGISDSLSDTSFDGFENIGALPEVENITLEFESAEDILARVQKKIKQMLKQLAKTDFSKIGAKLSDFAIVALDTAIEAIEKVDWELLGEKIGDFIGGIDWLEIIKNAFELKFNIWKAIADVWFGAYQAAPIITALGALKFSGLGAVLGKSIAKAISGSALVTSITGAFASLGGIGGILTMDLATVIGAGSLAEIGLAVGTGIIGGIVAAIGGWNFGQWLYETLSGQEIDMTWAEQFEAIKESFSDGSWKGALDLMWEDINAGLTDIAIGVSDWWEDTVRDIKKWLQDLGFAIDGFYGSHTSESGFTHGGGGNRYSTYSFVMPQINAPALATGAVIPPNAPFMAMLGDQKHGTNIEAPLDTIKQAVGEVISELGIHVTFDVESDEAQIFRVTQRQAESYTERTGMSAFPTG